MELISSFWLAQSPKLTFELCKGVKLSKKEFGVDLRTRFPNRPFMIRVPFFLLFGFNRRTPKYKGQKGSTQEPREGSGGSRLSAENPALLRPFFTMLRDAPTPLPAFRSCPCFARNSLLK